VPIVSSGIVMQQSNAPAMPPATSVRQPPFFLSLLPIANSRCYPRPRSRHAEVAAGARLAGGMNAVAPGASSPSVWRVVDATTTYAVPWRATPATTVLPARLPALRRVHSAQCTAGAQRRALGDAWMHGSAVRGLPASSGSIDAVQHSCLKAPQHRRRSRDGATHAMRTAARPCTSTYGRAACQPVTVSTEILSKHRCAGQLYMCTRTIFDFICYSSIVCGILHVHCTRIHHSCCLQSPQHLTMSPTPCRNVTAF
jgi:hypothetical protein